MKVIYNNGTVDQCPEAEELEVLRHSAAHIMAQAVQRLYPHAKFAYGPATEKGFYYTKLNAAYSLGGIECLKETIENKDYYNNLKENCKIEKDNILSVGDYCDILLKEYKKLLER